MAADIVRHRRVYLQPLDLVKQSRHHTAHAVIRSVNGNTPVSLEFWNGVAMDVPAQIFDVFKDLGIAGLVRPKLPNPDDDDPDAA